MPPIAGSNAGRSDVSAAALVDTLPAGTVGAGNRWTCVARSATGGATFAGSSSGSGALSTTVNLPSASTLTIKPTVQFASSDTSYETYNHLRTLPSFPTRRSPDLNTATDTDTPAPVADLS